MHVSTALDTFKAYKEAVEAYVEQREVVKQVKAALALLMATTSEGKKSFEKASKKYSKKASEKALQKTKQSTASADAPAPELHAEY
jgi:predicted metal-binding protein